MWTENTAITNNEYTVTRGNTIQYSFQLHLRSDFGATFSNPALSCHALSGPTFSGPAFSVDLLICP